MRKVAGWEGKRAPWGLVHKDRAPPALHRQSQLQEEVAGWDPCVTPAGSRPCHGLPPPPGESQDPSCPLDLLVWAGTDGVMGSGWKLKAPETVGSCERPMPWPT